jgi:DnaK suppressor protein
MIERRQPLDTTLAADFRRRLLEARQTLLRTVAGTDEELTSLDATAPGDTTDRATAASIARTAARLAGQDKRELDEIAEALRRLASGAFGTCESCHQPIGLPRLRAVPATRFCVRCQTAQEVIP